MAAVAIYGTLLRIVLCMQILSNSAPVPKGPKRATIPLEKCYSTIEQKVSPGFNHDPETPEGKQQPNVFPRFNCDSETPEGRHNLKVIRALSGRGASNIFVVKGKDLRAIVDSTLEVLIRHESADDPFRRRFDPPDGNPPFWLFVYLGVDAAEPPKWEVKEITREGQTITVKVKEHVFQARNTDSSPYILWAPLGDLPRRPHKLRIVDADTGSVRLLRLIKPQRSP